MLHVAVVILMTTSFIITNIFYLIYTKSESSGSEVKFLRSQIVSSVLILINYMILLALFMKYGTTNASDSKISVESQVQNNDDLETIS